jgi:hypothetical protein
MQGLMQHGLMQHGLIQRGLTRHWGERRRVAGSARNIARLVGERALRLFVIAGFALSLAACDKCSMPVWRHDTPAAPQSCHDDTPAPQ